MDKKVTNKLDSKLRKEQEKKEKGIKRSSRSALWSFLARSWYTKTEIWINSALMSKQWLNGQKLNLFWFGQNSDADQNEPALICSEAAGFHLTHF